MSDDRFDKWGENEAPEEFGSENEAPKGFGGENEGEPNYKGGPNYTGNPNYTGSQGYMGGQNYAGRYSRTADQGYTKEQGPNNDRLNQGGYGNYNYGQYGYHNGYNASDYRWNIEDYESSTRVKPQKKNGGLMVFGTFAALILVIGVLVFSIYGAFILFTGSKAEELPYSQSQPEGNMLSPELTIKERPVESSQVTENGKMTTAEIARKVRPSVVGIAQYTDADTFTPASEGSGIIINSDGYIVTNAHVVRGAAGINVTLDNGESYSAQLIGIDSKTDLAVIKIEEKNLVAAEFGNSDQIEVGETAIAIGNPGGSTLAGSVTQGIVSAINRTIREEGYSGSYIQTDAAINPGNSGGALVNEYGQVIGINASKIAAVEYEGIGFAIPSNEVKPIIDDLMRYGHVTGRVKIGISGQEINEALSQINSIPVGVYIWSVDPTSDLAGKSVAKGDIIIKIDNTTIENFDDIAKALEGKNPGESITMTLYRSARGSSNRGQTFEVSCKLMEDVDPSAIR